MIFLEVLFYGFIVVVFLQLFYYLILFGRFVFYKPKPKPKQINTLPISIIICAKNEAESLQSYLPLFSKQDYSEFELVLVNDRSSDSTLEVMEAFSKTNNYTTIVNVRENETFWGSKKYALTLGIKAAKHNHLLLTDADCKPLSKDWIKEMSSEFQESKNIILGYGAYSKVKHSFLNKLIRFETLLTAVQYFSYALSGMPYMGVGRNLAYTKDVFFKSNGFADHMNIMSGDDDLFINQNANTNNVAICLNPKGFTKSAPETSFGEWFNQKKRHVSTSTSYKLKHKILLALFYISQILFWVFGILLLVLAYQPIIIASLVGFIIILKYCILGVSAKKLLEKDLIILLPILEVFLICFQLFIFISNPFSIFYWIHFGMKSMVFS